MPTYSRNEQYIDHSINFLKQNWPNHPSLLVVTDGVLSGPNVINIKSDFVAMLREAVRQLEEAGYQSIVLILEDLAPLWPVDDQSVFEACLAVEKGISNHVVFFPQRHADFRPHTSMTDKVEEAIKLDCTILRKQRVNYSYPNQLQVSVWRTSYLAKLCEEATLANVTNPWEFEKHRHTSWGDVYVSSYQWPTVFNGFLTRGGTNPTAVYHMPPGPLRDALSKSYTGHPLRLFFIVRYFLARSSLLIRQAIGK